MPAKAVIFDLEGTLVDLFDYHVHAYDQLFYGKFGIHFQKEDLSSRYGMLPKDIVRDFLASHGMREQVDFARLAEEKQKLFRKISNNNVKVMPGTVKLLQQLKKSGFKIALGSSSPRRNVEFMLKVPGLYGYFDAIVAGEDVENGKPAPDVFLEAAGRLGLKPQECVVIGDSVHDSVGAAKAGMKAVIVANNEKPDQRIIDSKPVRIVSSLEALTVSYLEGV